MVVEAEDIKWLIGVVVLPVIALIWKRHERDHKLLEEEQKDIREETQTLKETTSVGYSTLNDRVMEHIDKQVAEVRAFVIQEDSKLMNEVSLQRGYIGKIFDKMEAHAIRSEDRHSETMAAIHTLATTMHQALAQKADK